MDIIVGLGDISISKAPGDIIKTFALASCVGITAYCAPLHIAGMIHIVLPKPSEYGVSNHNLSYYASTGVPLFIHKMQDQGCRKSELEVKVYGGAAAVRIDDCFNIGSRNLHSVQNLLSRLNVRYTLVNVGGSISRTLFMDVATGAVKVITLPILF